MESKFKPLKSQAGQGVIEYILVLTVVVMIALGLIYQFNDSFRVWATNFFGQYLACLIETGELPALGGTGGTASECAQFMEGFDSASGSQLYTSSPGAAGVGPTNSASGAAGSSDRATGGGAGGGGNVFRAGGGRFTAGPGRFGDRGPAQAVPTDGSASEESTRTGGSGFINVGSSGSRIPIKSNGLSRWGTTLEDEENRPKAKGSTTVIRTEAYDNSKKSKFKVEEPKRKENDGGNDEGMGFGNFIRFLIIAAIVIALVMLISGQLLQVSKSSE